jgi:hypothetical protein
MDEELSGISPELVMPGGEKRTYPRVALSVPVRFTVVGDEGNCSDNRQILEKGLEKLAEGGGSLDSETVNLSSGGLLMTTESPLPAGSKLCMNIYLPLPGIACNCDILGKVIRNDRIPGTPGYRTAITFLKVIHHNLNRAKHTALKELLDTDGPEIKL